MVTVPHVVSDVPALHKDPVVAFLPDLFTRPAPMRADIVIDVTEQMETIAAMLACHRSQVFEWLAYEEDVLDTVPEGERERLEWVQIWFANHIRPRSERYRDKLVDACGDQRGAAVEFIEMFEISEYARQPDAEYRRQLFPDMLDAGGMNNVDD
jgi:hypothetical protein